MNCKLEKISGTRTDGLRTPSIEGRCMALPVPGESFIMGAAALDKSFAGRAIRTSPIKTVEWTDKTSCMFYTHNSLYRLTVLDKQE